MDQNTSKEIKAHSLSLWAGPAHHLTRFLELIEINDYQFGKTKIHFDKYINLNIIRAGGPVY